MVKKILLSLVVLTGVFAAPRPAMAGCTTDLLDCYRRAGGVCNLLGRWAGGPDLELGLAGWVRGKLVGPSPPPVRGFGRRHPPSGMARPEGPALQTVQR